MMKKAMRKLKTKILNILKISILVWVTTLGIFFTYLAISYSFGWLQTEFAFWYVALATIFSEIFFLAWLSE